MRFRAMGHGCDPRFRQRRSRRPAIEPGDLRAHRHTFARFAHPNARHRDIMQIDYPFQPDMRGRTATTNDDDHVRDLIEQVLFTSPGERVNRPTFGSGLLQLVFAPNSDTLAAATQMSVQGALQQWLGDLIEVQAVEVTNIDSALHVVVQYVSRQDRQPQTAEFSRPI
jgi:phage baseplate assembly protein W